MTTHVLPTLINLDDFLPEASFNTPDEAMAYTMHQSARLDGMSLIVRAQNLAQTYRGEGGINIDKNLREVRKLMGTMREELSECDDPLYRPTGEKMVDEMEEKLNAIVFGIIDVPERYSKMGFELPQWYHDAISSKSTRWYHYAIRYLQDECPH